MSLQVCTNTEPLQVQGQVSVLVGTNTEPLEELGLQVGTDTETFNSLIMKRTRINSFLHHCFQIPQSKSSFHITTC